MKNLFQNSSILGAANILAAIAQFILIPIYLKLIGTTEFGKLILLQTIVLTVYTVVNTEVWIPLTRHLNLNSSAQNDTLLKSASIIDLSSFFVGGCIVLALFSINELFLNTAREIGLNDILFCVTSLFLVPCNTVQTKLRVEEKWKILALYSSAPTFLKLAVIAATGVNSMNDLYIKLVLCDFFRLPFLISIIYKKERISFPIVNQLIRSTLTGWFAKICDLPVNQFDRFFVGYFLGYQGLAAYHIVKSISAAFGQLIGPLYEVSFTLITKQMVRIPRHEIFKQYMSVTLYIFAFGFFGLISLLITSSLWAPILFSDQYTREELIINVYFQIFIQVFSLAFFYVHSAILSIGALRYNLIITFISNVMFILICLLTIRLGIIGVQAALFIQVTTSVIAKIFVIKMK